MGSRLKGHQGPAFRFVSRHDAGMAQSVVGEAADVQAVADRQGDWTGRAAAYDAAITDLLVRTLGRSVVRDIIAGRAVFCALGDGRDFHEVLGRLSRTIRLTVSAGLLMAEHSGRMPLGPVSDSAQGALYLLALEPASVRVHAKAWLAALKLSELRCALARWQGLGLAALACRFEEPFDGGDVLPCLAQRLPVQAPRVAA